MSSLLKLARTIPHNFHLRALIQGGLKSGKTTLLGTYPGSLLLLDVDGGAASLAALPNIKYLTVGRGLDVPDSEALIELLIELQKDTEFDAVALDTISVLNANLLLEQAELRGEVKASADPNRQEIQDYQHVRNQILRIMNAFLAVQKDVFIVAHTFDDKENGEPVKKVNVTPKNLITEIPARLNQQFYLAVQQEGEDLQRVLLMNNHPGFNVGCHVTGRAIPNELPNPTLSAVIQLLRGKK